jgi:putative endonuclease
VFELLYVEEVIGMRNALDRERQLKNWHRQWKINLIRSQNPEMVDLAKDWFTDEELVKGRLRARFRNRVRKGGR